MGVELMAVEGQLRQVSSNTAAAALLEKSRDSQQRSTMRMSPNPE